MGRARISAEIAAEFLGEEALKNEFLREIRGLPEGENFIFGNLLAVRPG